MENENIKVFGNVKILNSKKEVLFEKHNLVTDIGIAYFTQLLTGVNDYFPNTLVISGTSQTISVSTTTISGIVGSVTTTPAAGSSAVWEFEVPGVVAATTWYALGLMDASQTILFNALAVNYAHGSETITVQWTITLGRSS